MMFLQASGLLLGFPYRQSKNKFLCISRVVPVRGSRFLRPQRHPGGVLKVRGEGRSDLEASETRRGDLSVAPESRCCFVSILGPSNTGKSTLVNAMVGSKVAIVSPKVQTTRFQVRGIAIEETLHAQIVFIDTPGVFLPKRKFDQAMVKSAWEASRGADIVLVMLDGNRYHHFRKLSHAETSIAERLSRIDKEELAKTPILLAVNKIDLIPRKDLDAVRDGLLHEMGGPERIREVHQISARTGEGVFELRRRIAELAPLGPWHYDREQLTDIPERLLAAEVVREQLYLQLRQELPYECAVETERWESKEDGSVVIGCVIYVKRQSQKAIVAGAGGVRIKSIGVKARMELERLLGRRVHLLTLIKCRKWDENPVLYRQMGLDFRA
jgi:GTP-binding protein Era